jgi:very-short-patch-repair endonuclease
VPAGGEAGLVGSPLTALVAADAALHRTVITPLGLSTAVASFAGHAGIGEVRAVLTHADGRIESVGESLLAHTLRLLGIAFTPQVRVATDSGLFRADFAVDGTRVLVEFDGKVKYDRPRALFDEKQREDALRREGWVVVRFVWADLRHPARLARRIDEAVALSRRAG